MLVVQTAGDPPKAGRMILATIGCIRNRSAELRKMVTVYRMRKMGTTLARRSVSR
jgi:hypothetical protein